MYMYIGVGGHFGIGLNVKEGTGPELDLEPKFDSHRGSRII